MRRTSIDECFCQSGYYKMELNDSLQCVECPQGTACYLEERGAPGLAYVPIRPGYYRRSPVSDDIQRCPDSAANCSGGAPECIESTSGCRGTVAPRYADILWSNTSGGCQPTLTGVFCQLCAPSNASVYYVRASRTAAAHCASCSKTLRTSLLAYLLMLATLAMGAFCFWRRRHHAPKQQNLVGNCFKRRELAATVRQWLKQLTIGVKAKIMIDFFMIASKIPSVYEVEMPSEVADLLQVFSFGLTFGLSGIRALLECLGTSGYLSILMAYLLAPIILACIALLMASVRLAATMRLTSTALMEATVPLLLRLSFFAYPVCPAQLLQSASCSPHTPHTLTTYLPWCAVGHQHRL